MPPIRLAVIASDALASVWSYEEAHPNLLEVNTWTSLEDVHRFHELLPEQPLLLHGGNLLGAPLTQRQQEALRALVERTNAPWVSAHISLWPWKILQDARQQGRQPSALDLGPHLEHFFARVRALREDLGIQLILENAPSLPGIENDPESDPETIVAVLEATGCAFLLDLSHAQTAAANWGYHDPERYLARLPLHRIVELHLSAPSQMEDGRLVDAHEPLREQDYYLLNWVLQRATPQVVTLEYWKDSRALLGQIRRLKDELAIRQSSS